MLLVEFSGLFKYSILEEHSGKRGILLKFLTAEENVDLNSFLHQVHINQFLVSLAVNGREYCLCDVVEQRLKDYGLEDLEPLVGEWS